MDCGLGVAREEEVNDIYKPWDIFVPMAFFCFDLKLKFCCLFSAT